LELQATTRPAAAYLVASCQFLLELNSSRSVFESCESPSVRGDSPKSTAAQSIRTGNIDRLSFRGVLLDRRLSVEDRVAFASLYLPDSDLSTLLGILGANAQESGNLEGLVVTGLGADGARLLQKYLDQSGDIQTVALLMCQIGGAGGDATGEESPGKYWLGEYRQLLNRWKMFIERAELDVELARRRRLGQAVAVPTNEPSISSPAKGHPPAGGGGAFAKGGGGGGGSSGDKKPAAVRAIYSLPPATSMPHLYLRCHYCSTSLPVDALQKQHQTSTTLRRIRPLMTCCPHCKQPLPRCYVCLLYMGLVNPQIELKLAMRRKSATSLSTSVSTSGDVGKSKSMDAATDDVMDLGKESISSKYDLHNVLSTGHWFMWCQSCKHGGHASCIDQWFHEDSTARRLCGVNGCNCRCVIEK